MSELEEIDFLHVYVSKAPPGRCVLVVIVLGLREKQCFHIENVVSRREQENSEDCKRRMCSLITIMAVVAFHLPSLKQLVTPPSR